MPAYNPINRTLPPKDTQTYVVTKNGKDREQPSPIYPIRFDLTRRTRTRQCSAAPQGRNIRALLQYRQEIGRMGSGGNGKAA